MGWRHARETLVLLAGLAMSRDVAANVTLLTFEQDGSVLTVTSEGTVDAIIRRANITTVCHYTLAANDLTSVETSLRDPDVRAALHAKAVFTGSPMRLVAGSDAVEWRTAGGAANAPYAITLFRLELQVQLLKAQIRCRR